MRYTKNKLFFLMILIFLSKVIYSRFQYCTCTRKKKLAVLKKKDEEEKLHIFSENLLLFDKIMKKHNIFYWVGEGTALGFIREKNFIKHDEDVDVRVWYKDKLKVSFVHYEFAKNGFQIRRHMPFSLKRKGYYIDIDFTGLNYPAMAYRWPNISNNFINYIEPFRYH